MFGSKYTVDEFGNVYGEMPQAQKLSLLRRAASFINRMAIFA